ncbi:DUF1294 domain-containing protein [Methylophilus medardicus]|uniref:DUF1294 domain-containing protein n=1 Tax=Methylophilus medardicus TaxID=2588534 RepID=A0A5B8CSR4_9PROT|nr:DUF1294 domain-containing protein [Methylophilus medardicus]QDC44116.1 DUF1294 domain-containing protein [Methylophilus medardicus]QDC49123.1 DUF1294 domain-containing protein [Methylophilus medardicus]QDC52828.1 DUF1294 domain-containing protein [Methylophilus medardicus]
MSLPAWLFCFYLLLNLITIIVYYLDKRAARQKERRVSETTLHLLALLGGWPGAIVAQQLFRHKTQKRVFKVVFWLTVLLHCAAIAWLIAEHDLGRTLL